MTIVLSENKINIQDKNLISFVCIKDLFSLKVKPCTVVIILGTFKSLPTIEPIKEAFQEIIEGQNKKTEKESIEKYYKTLLSNIDSIKLY